MLGKLLDRFRQKGPSRPRSKAETEKRRRLLIVLLIVLAVVSSVSVVGYGYYDTNIRPWHQRIVKVNGTVFDMRDFVKMLRLQQSYSSYFSSTAEWAQWVVTAMEENELKRQELEGTYSISIDEEAVDAELRGMLVSDNAPDEEFDEQYDNLVTTLKKLKISMRDFRELYLKPPLISDELQKQIGDALYPTTDNVEHAQVQALLITGSDNATQLRARWESGEAFDTLATDNSVSESVKDVGTDNATNWVARGMKSVAFDNYTFSADIGVLSEPIQDSDSSEDYWLIKVSARESRPLSESDRSTLISEAYSKWLEDAKNPENSVIVNYLDEKGGEAKLSWAVEHL